MARGADFVAVDRPLAHRLTSALQRDRDAMAAYEVALDQAPDDGSAHNNRGNVLQRVGDVQASLSQHTDSLQRLEAALASHSQSLEIAPNHE